MREIDDFILNWGEESLDVKDIFADLYSFLQKQSAVTLGWSARPGISYSLRLSAANPPAERPFFAMLDIIDDDPEERWISMCMYADMADDPDGKGDVVPKGLNNQDALCFDIDENDEEICGYLKGVLQRMIDRVNS